MGMQPNQVMEELREGKYHPVYFLQGEEPYFIDLIADYIETHALDEAEKGFNQIIMYGKDSTVDAVLTNARRFPMMANRQVIIVKEAQEIANFGRQDAQKLLESYIENPLPSTTLVFCYKYKTLDGRKSVSKSIAKKTILVDCRKIYDDKIPGWVRDYVKSKHATIDYPTAQLLSDYIGNNLERLSGEIDKVLLNLPSPAKIDSEAVQKFVGISKEYNVFELQKALTIRDNVKAQRIVKYFIANPKLNPVIPVIAVLFAFFSKLLVVQQLGSNSEQALAKELKVRPFFVKDYVRAAGNYTQDQVVNNIAYLRSADVMVKGVDNQQPHGEILKELIFKLMH
jgi:DNA polymerase-3 subunit delta